MFCLHCCMTFVIVTAPLSPKLEKAAITTLLAT